MSERLRITIQRDVGDQVIECSQMIHTEPLDATMISEEAILAQLVADIRSELDAAEKRLNKGPALPLP